MNKRFKQAEQGETSASDGDSAALLEALRALSTDPQLSQRQLSQALGLSLGKTHYVLHALLDKGLVKVQNFRRSDNKLAYAYLLTPKGMNEKLAMKASHSNTVVSLCPSPSNAETRPRPGWVEVAAYTGVLGSIVGSNCATSLGIRGSALFLRTMNRGDSGNQGITKGRMKADSPQPSNMAPVQP